MQRVVAFGEVMLHLTPPQQLTQATSLTITCGEGGANVAAALAYMGVPIAHVSVFPANDLVR